MLKAEMPLAALTMLGMRLAGASGVLDGSTACSFGDDVAGAVCGAGAAEVEGSRLSCSEALRLFGKRSGYRSRFGRGKALFSLERRARETIAFERGRRCLVSETGVSPCERRSLSGLAFCSEGVRRRKVEGSVVSLGVVAVSGAKVVDPKRTRGVKTAAPGSRSVLIWIVGTPWPWCRREVAGEGLRADVRPAVSSHTWVPPSWLLVFERRACPPGGRRGLGYGDAAEGSPPGSSRKT